MELQLNQGKEMSHLRNLQIAKKNASLEECFQVNSLWVTYFPHIFF